MLSLAFSAEDAKMTTFIPSSYYPHPPMSHPQTCVTKKLMGGRTMLSSLSWESAAETCGSIMSDFYSPSDSVGVTGFVSCFWSSQHIKGGKNGSSSGKQDKTERSQDYRVRMGNIGNKSFVPVKAWSVKDHWREAYSWAESDLVTQCREGGCPKGTVYCCSRRRKEAPLLDLGSCWKFQKRVLFLHWVQLLR